MPYVTREELTEKCNEIKDEFKKEMKTIRDNDLHAIKKRVDDLRWFVLGASAVLGLVLAILEVRG